MVDLGVEEDPKMQERRGENGLPATREEWRLVADALWIAMIYLLTRDAVDRG